MIYSYDQLKGKIKVGDKVRAVPGKYNPCGQTRDDGSNTVKITRVGDDDFCIDGCAHQYSGGCWLEIVEHIPTWDTLTLGDKIESIHQQYTVLVVIDDLVGYTDKSNNVFWQTKTVLKGDPSPWKVVAPVVEKPTPREVTMADVVAKFGEDVVIKKE